MLKRLKLNPSCRLLIRMLFVVSALFAALLLLPGLSRAEGSARWPAEPSKKSLKKDGSLQVDLSNVSEGYFLACMSKSTSSRLKLRVTKGGETLTYDLNGKGEFEVFPLQLGNGKYEISLYKNVSGKKYTSEGKVSVKVNMDDPNSCFLYPNQYVNYTPETEPVAEAENLGAGKEDPEVYDTMCRFMANTFVYDFVKAVTIKAGVLPDIEGSYAKRMGVCQDLSAIMCCMLRTQGIPAKLMIGYADSNYHAWVVAVIDGKEVFFDPTAAVNGIGKVKEYSVERFY